ncbi:MAG: DMT family transporter, partial [Ilumatobacteraceae bacterium]
ARWSRAVAIAPVEHNCTNRSRCVRYRPRRPTYLATLDAISIRSMFSSGKKGSAPVAAVIVASCLFASGGALMKASDGFTRVWPSSAVVVLFVVGAYLFAMALRTNGLGAVWVVGLGIEAVVSIVLGLVLFSEQFSSFQIAGLVLILGGTVLTELA